MSTISRALLLLILPAAVVPPVLRAMPKAAIEEVVHVTAAPTTIEIGAVAPAAGKRLVLHLDDVRLAAGQGAVFRVFVNRPDATATTPTGSGGFVEELFLVPSRTRATTPGARQPGQNLALPLPPGSLKPGSPINVTLVPVRPNARGQLAAPGKTDLTLKRPYVTQEP
jgi:hypothetical protein